jgi:L-aminopeptidase/D-esterase-like protein
MATRRAQFENMSEGEREAMRATAQAGGGIGVGRGGAGGGAGAGGGVGGIGQARLMLRPLIDLLSERAGAAET